MTIKAGDLVAVVYKSFCCGNDLTVGRVFKVQTVGKKVSYCRHCGRVRERVFAIQPNGLGMDVNRLVVIRPPAQQSTNTTQQKNTETA